MREWMINTRLWVWAENNIFTFYFITLIVGLVCCFALDKCNAAEIVELQPGQADTTIECREVELFSLLEVCDDGDTLLYYKFPRLRTICDTVIVRAVEEEFGKMTVVLKYKYLEDSTINPEAPHHECKNISVWNLFEDWFCNHPECAPKPCTCKCGGK